MLRAMGLILIALAVFLGAASWGRASDEALDSRMYHDPELPSPKIVMALPENPLPLWLVALGRPEADYQCRAALVIVLAHKEGVKGLEAAVEPLLEALARLDSPAGPNNIAPSNPSDSGTGSSPNALIRLAVARALIELDARQTAPQLFLQTQGGDRRLRELIEPALARWTFRPAVRVWLERLRRPDMSAGDLLLAIRGLAALRESKATPFLKELVHSTEVPWPTRLEAARALGVIQDSGLEPDARNLVGESGSTDVGARLAAAWLLRHHQGEEAIGLLQTLGRDPEPAVDLIALERLLEINSKHVLPVIGPALASPDAKVREIAVETLHREATLERLALLADRLDDEYSHVRIKARVALHDLAAKPQFRDAIIREGSRILAGQDWRGLEQATILLVQLDHKPAADRLLQLLVWERPEVSIAAAWGLRRLDVPEILPLVLSHFRSFRGLSDNNATTAKLDQMPPLAVDQQFSHLAQFMGQRRYQPAEATFRRFVPRIMRAALVGQETRAAAIWALGFILEGNADPGLARQLEERLSDIPKGLDPGEDPRVRRMSAITLARMKSKESEKTLRRFNITAKPNLDPVAHACSWAIQQLFGEVPPPPGSVELPSPGTFKNWLRNRPELKPTREGG
jgi:HEAT repeat protein